MSGETTPAAAETESAKAGRDFDFFRWRLGDAIAVLAAFALLFIMAGDWYSTRTGVEAREIVERQGTEQPGAGLFDDGAVEDARVEAEQAERNAWQVSSPLDVLVLVALLAAIALTFGAAALRAAGREYPDPRRSPTAIAAAAALVALLLVAIQAGARLDPDSDVTVRIGLPLAVAALGMIACGAGLALREERSSEPTASGAPDEAPASGRGAETSGA
jgi:hypothetical protein